MDARHPRQNVTHAINDPMHLRYLRYIGDSNENNDPISETFL